MRNTKSRHFPSQRLSSATLTQPHPIASDRNVSGTATQRESINLTISFRRNIFDCMVSKKQWIGRRVESRFAISEKRCSMSCNTCDLPSRSRTRASEVSAPNIRARELRRMAASAALQPRSGDPKKITPHVQDRMDL